MSTLSESAIAKRVVTVTNMQNVLLVRLLVSCGNLSVEGNDVILPMSRLHAVPFTNTESLCYEILATGYYCKYIKTRGPGSVVSIGTG